MQNTTTTTLTADDVRSFMWQVSARTGRIGRKVSCILDGNHRTFWTWR